MVVLCSHQDATKVLFHVIHIMHNNVLITRKTYTHDHHIHSFQHKICIYCFTKRSYIYIYIYNAKKFPSIIVRYKSCYVHDYTFFVHSLISRWLCVYMISIIQQKYLTYFHATSFSCPIFQFLVTSYKLKS